MKIGYSDFATLCRITDKESLAPWLLVLEDGVYVVPPSDSVAPGERSVLSEHPTGNLKEPALQFPCDLHELQAFLEDNGVYHSLDAFEMAKWIEGKVRKGSNAAGNGKQLGTTERSSLLAIIAALCKEINLDYQAHGAATLIQGLTQKNGAPVSDDTIRRHLKQIPEALERCEK